MCVNCSLQRLVEKLENLLIIYKSKENLISCLNDQISLIKTLVENMKRMLIDQDDLEQRIKDLKRSQIRQFPEFNKILEEPYYKKKGLVRSHNEIIKFPVRF